MSAIWKRLLYWWVLNSVLKVLWWKIQGRGRVPMGTSKWRGLHIKTLFPECMALSSALEKGRIRECEMEESKPAPSFWCWEQHKSWLNRESDRGRKAGLADPRGEAGTGQQKNSRHCHHGAWYFTNNQALWKSAYTFREFPLSFFLKFYLSKFLWTLFKTSKVRSPGPTWKLLSAVVELFSLSL